MSDVYPTNGNSPDRRSGQDRRRPPQRTGPQASDRRGQLRRLLRPGLGIKRWLVVVFLGMIFLALAAGVGIRALTSGTGQGGGVNLFDFITLQSLPTEIRVLILAVVGSVLFGWGVWRLLNVVLEPYRERTQPLVELLFQRRLRARGPHIVAIGGGTGLSTLLRGLKEITSNITAVVTVADDGGSSGKLRTQMGLPPMGDIRACIEALADAEPQMRRLLSYRFLMPLNPNAEVADETTPFVGHPLGNLLIAALTDVTGNFEEAVRQANRVLAVRGKVVPVAGTPITLHAELADGTIMDGQSRIGRASGIRSVWITPHDVHPAAEALEAIADAELIVIGPGSLYTSLLPPLLVPGIREALAAASAPRVYVCNVATQVGETESFGLAAHIAALDVHGMGGLIDAVLVNGNFQARQPHNYPAAPVEVDLPLSGRDGPTLFTRDVVDDENAHHHDAHKLATALLTLHDERAIRRRQPIDRPATGAVR